MVFILKTPLREHRTRFPYRTGWKNWERFRPQPVCIACLKSTVVLSCTTMKILMMKEPTWGVKAACGRVTPHMGSFYSSYRHVSRFRKIWPRSEVRWRRFALDGGVKKSAAGGDGRDKNPDVTRSTKNKGQKKKEVPVRLGFLGLPIDRPKGPRRNFLAWSSGSTGWLGLNPEKAEHDVTLRNHLRSTSGLLLWLNLRLACCPKSWIYATRRYPRDTRHDTHGAEMALPLQIILLVFLDQNK